MAILAALAAAPAASAQSSAGCAEDGGIVSTADVRVTSPSPGSAVTGPTVSVRGTATVLLGRLSRVEATFGGRTGSQNFDASASVDFDITIDAARVPAGPTILTVVACGSLARGSEQYTVAYEPAAVATSTTLARPTTTAASSGGGGGGGGTVTTSASAGPSASVAPAGAGTTAPGQTTVPSQATTTAAPAPVEAPAPAAGARPQPVRPRTNADGSVVLSDSPDRGSPRPPLWVGAVVGVSGGIGLLFSATTWRRRSRSPERLDPVDPDLVEVG